MTSQRMRRLAFVLLGLLSLDWLLGVLIVLGRLPLWMFAVANFAFGLLHFGLESIWSGTCYVVGGQTVGEIGSLGMLLLVVVAQVPHYVGMLERRLPRT